MVIFHQVLPVFQIIQFLRAAPWNTYFYISKLILIFKNMFIPENVPLVLVSLHLRMKTGIKMSISNKRVTIYWAALATVLLSLGQYLIHCRLIYYV